ncbi:MAG: DAK2 domain-containing protein [Sulfobacillus sp.]
MSHAAKTVGITRITAGEFTKWLGRALTVLRREVERIDRINVFPVPDGDTGHNMLGTLEAAVQAVLRIPSHHLGHQVRVAAEGAVMGARGNSGTILSQFLVGLAQSGGDKEEWSLSDFRQALAHAADVAYQGVYQPVEGTMLTITRTLAQNAYGDDVGQILANMVKAAHDAVLRTPSMLPALRDQGVVDAGAEGLYLIVAAFANENVQPVNMVASPEAVSATRRLDDIPYPYDTEALISPWHQNQALSEIRSQLASWGDSVVVSEMGSSLKVHVHTTNPADLTRFLFALGPVVQMEILDMRHQMHTLGRPERRPVVMDPAWGPVMPIAVDLVEPSSAMEPDVLWVGEDYKDSPRGLASPALACQLFVDYNEDQSWEDNLKVLLASSRTMVSLSVAKDHKGYQVGDLAMANRDQAVLAAKAVVGVRRMVTLYVSLDDWDGEAEWWQTQLDAEVVNLPAEVARRVMEIVAQ